jgi:hypothetical protein
MSQVKSSEIHCGHCGEWFPSPIAFGDSGSLDISVLTDNLVMCPNCGKGTACNKENMLIRPEDGTLLGTDTLDS